MSLVLVAIGCIGLALVVAALLDERAAQRASFTDLERRIRRR